MKNKTQIKRKATKPKTHPPQIQQSVTGGEFVRETVVSVQRHTMVSRNHSKMAHKTHTKQWKCTETPKEQTQKQATAGLRRRRPARLGDCHPHAAHQSTRHIAMHLLVPDSRTQSNHRTRNAPKPAPAWRALATFAGVAIWRRFGACGGLRHPTPTLHSMCTAKKHKKCAQKPAQTGVTCEASARNGGAAPNPRRRRASTGPRRGGAQDPLNPLKRIRCVYVCRGGGGGNSVVWRWEMPAQGAHLISVVSSYRSEVNLILIQFDLQ